MAGDLLGEGRARVENPCHEDREAQTVGEGRGACDVMMEMLGAKLRKQRRRLGLTLDELAGRTGISKPYLSLIETGRVPNPPSDEKLRKLEMALGFGAGELVTQAHLQRTPRDVRVMLQRLMMGREGKEGSGVRGQGVEGKKQEEPVNLDDAYLSGVLQELV